MWLKREHLLPGPNVGNPKRRGIQAPYVIPDYVPIADRNLIDLPNLQAGAGAVRLRISLVHIKYVDPLTLLEDICRGYRILLGVVMVSGTARP